MLRWLTRHLVLFAFLVFGAAGVALRDELRHMSLADLGLQVSYAPPSQRARGIPEVTEAPAQEPPTPQPPGGQGPAQSEPQAAAPQPAGAIPDWWGLTSAAGGAGPRSLPPVAPDPPPAIPGPDPAGTVPPATRSGGQERIYSFRPLGPEVAPQAQERRDELLSAARRAYWTGELDQAVAGYLDFVAAFPEEPDSHGELGNVYYQQGKLELAAKAYYDAALLLARQGDSEAVRRLAELILKLAPEYRASLQSLLSEEASPTGGPGGRPAVTSPR